MNNKKAPLLIFILLVFAFIYYRMGKISDDVVLDVVVEDSFEQSPSHDRTVQKDTASPREVEAPISKSEPPKRLKDLDSSDFFATGETIAKLAAGDVGFEQEGGGIGVAGITYDPSGRIVILDRFKREIYTVNDRGEKSILMEFDENDVLKGIGFNESGEMHVLVGMAELDLVTVDSHGNERRKNISLKPEHLNAMRVHAQEDRIYFFGQDKTYEFSNDTINEYYGTPIGFDDRVLDVTLTESGSPVLTLRDKDGTPFENFELEGSHGSIQGVYPSEGETNVIIFESDPFQSDFNARNPHFTINRVSERGEVLSEIIIPFDSELIIDQPIEIRGDRVFYSRQNPEDGLEVVEYRLP